MSSLYLYAIVDRTDQGLPDLAGIGDAALLSLSAGELLAVVSPVSAGQVPLTRANLLRHEAVVEALMPGRGVLPVRFGTTGSQQGLSEALARHGETFTHTLERVRGRVELALRVFDAGPTEAPVARPRAAQVASGREYIQALLTADQHESRRRVAAEALTERITAALTPLADAVIQERPAQPKLLMKAAFLLPPERVALMRERIAGLQKDCPTLAFLATGPWPAYSFTELEQGPSLFDRTGENLR